MWSIVRLLRFTAVICAVSTVAAVPMDAQIDYRNLDDDRPTRIEDAYSVERYAFELLIPYSVERERGGATIHASVLELEYGLLPNAQIGIKAPLAIVRAGGTTTRGLSGLRAFALYNFNTESPVLPAFSLRADVAFPVGSLAGSDTHLTVKGIVTRSFGRTRLHLNGAYSFGPDGTPAAVEAAEQWWYGAALDRTLFRQSILIVGEVYALRMVRGSPTEVNATLGLRWQWRPTAVIDLGVARRLRQNAGPDIAITIGVSNAFAIPGLVPRGR
jgi:hypothetical protein